MNKVTWAIQTNFIADDQCRKIWAAAEKAGCATQEIIIIPFSDEFGNEADVPEMDGIVIPYGSISLINRAIKRKWTGMYFNEETFRVEAWLKNRADMLNSDCNVMRVGDTGEFFKGHDEEERYFIRPVKDLKEFNGTVTTVAEIKRWMQSVDSGNFSFSQDTLVSISPVQDINMEWRFFIVGGRIVDGSSYRTCGQLFSQPITDPTIYEEAQRLADIWLPHVNCVMDVALVDDEMRIIEFNALNGSGFYYHDIDKIVFAISDYARTQ